MGPTDVTGCSPAGPVSSLHSAVGHPGRAQLREWGGWAGRRQWHLLPQGPPASSHSLPGDGPDSSLIQVSSRGSAPFSLLARPEALFLPASPSLSSESGPQVRRVWVVWLLPGAQEGEPAPPPPVLSCKPGARPTCGRHWGPLGRSSAGPWVRALLPLSSGQEGWAGPRRLPEK